MSAQPDQSSDGQPAGGEGRFSTLIGSLAAATSTDRAAQDEQAAQDDEADGRPATPPRPTFTARASGPATAVPPEPTDATEPDGPGSRVRRAPAPDTPPEPAAAPTLATPAPTTPTPVATGPVPAAPAPATPALTDTETDSEETRALPRPAAAAPDEPLLGDVAALRVRWQRVQASFVDGPQEAVGDAADLIEQTAQALVGALRQRQRHLRMMWESGAKTASADGAQASGEPDTEHLRQMMQHYRALFNQLCRP